MKDSNLKKTILRARKKNPLILGSDYGTELQAFCVKTFMKQIIFDLNLNNTKPIAFT